LDPGFIPIALEFPKEILALGFLPSKESLMLDIGQSSKLQLVFNHDWIRPLAFSEWRFWHPYLLFWLLCQIPEKQG
jgi:hypothetical protein